MADGYASIVEALKKARATPYATNPLILGGGLEPQAKTEYGRAAESIVRGLMSGYGYEQANQQSAEMMGRYNDAVSNGNVNSLLSDPNLAEAGVAFIESRRQADLENKLAMERFGQQNALQLAGGLAQKGLAMGEDGSVTPVPGYAEAVANQARQAAEAERQAQMAAFGASQGQPQQPRPENELEPVDRISQLAGDPLEVQVQSMARKLMTEGAASPAQAYQTAREILRGQLDVNKSSYKDEIQMREEARGLRDLAEKAKAGAQRAGYTGFGSGVAQLGAKALSNVGAFKEEAKGYALLDEILPSLIAAKRPPGAFTEREWGFIKASGPSTDNSREQNQLLAGIIDRGASLAEQRVDYLAEMRDRGLDRNKAERLWDEYRNSFSLFNETEQGMQVLDPPSWRQFVYSPIAPQAPQTQAPGQQAPGYTVQQLQAAGYSQQDIQALQQQGMVK
jgi:hypothetical protein